MFACWMGSVRDGKLGVVGQTKVRVFRHSAQVEGYAGVEVFMMSKVLRLFFSEICTPEGEKLERVQISKQSTQNL